ncbi:MvaI/BcnI family restriction endonuclease [Photobacterium damselae]|uniref:MvaI/BcnI family restriction endonuclease n=1 Tax=Photobacterium damselae TaxID=38293 RepID=UPI001F15915E|nr:MvaI/BcnI family restriction endonuclease [Photobacterium damselae]UKA04439.1 MvaI/BcnI family restriction endonuclease [Photobacterium damselae subsp. damselae]
MFQKEILKTMIVCGGKLSEQGWVDSLRNGSTGIGYTCESHLGIIENNRQEADFRGLIEIKTKRAHCSSRLTLFTLSPKKSFISVAALAEKFGKYKNNKRTLYTTINGAGFNSCRNEFGFRLRVDWEIEQIHLDVLDLKSGVIIFTGTVFTFANLKKIVQRKLSYLCLFNAETRVVNGIEQFKYDSGCFYRLKGFSEFLKAIENGSVVMELRVGVRADGTVHDHGTAWRVAKNKLACCFECVDRNGLM